MLKSRVVRRSSATVDCNDEQEIGQNPRNKVETISRGLVSGEPPVQASLLSSATYAVSLSAGQSGLQPVYLLVVLVQS
jgi:hypothetical protein